MRFKTFSTIGALTLCFLLLNQLVYAKKSKQIFSIGQYKVNTDYNTIHPHYSEINHRKRPRHKKKFPPGYFGLALSFGNDRFRGSNGTVSLNFPYTQTDANTNITTNQFASLSEKFQSSFLPVFGLGLDYLNRMVYGEAGVEFGGFTSQTSYINLYFGSGVTKKITKKGRFRYRVGARFINNEISNEIGRIDNYQKFLDINGDNGFNPTFKATVPKGRGTTTEILDADYLSVEINQSNIGLNPQIGIEYWAKNGWIIYRFNAAYNVTIYNDNNIYFEQTNSSNKNASYGHTVSYKLNDPFIHFTNNGINAAIAPYSLNRLVINFQIVFKADFNKGTFRSPFNRRRYNFVREG